jgi:hypothetical protein
MSKQKKKNNLGQELIYPSGFYITENGVPFHALANPHGGKMSQETIDAIGSIAEAAAKMIESVCPVCGRHYGKGLEWVTGDGTRPGHYLCECGWSDKP